MYRLMLSFLIFLFFVAILLSFFKLLPFNPTQILITGVYFLAIAYISNQIIAYFFKVKPKIESQFITALILTLIIGPIQFPPNIFFLTFVPILAMASKYIINFHNKHIFNPAAFAVTFSAIALGKNASWWIGNFVMLPFIIIGGLYVLIKIRRLNMTFSFLLIFFLFILLTNKFMLSVIFSSLAPLLFFSMVMLTEPMTSPQDYRLRTYYAIICAVVVILFQRFTSISYSVELSLLVTNVIGRVITTLPRG